MSSLVGRTHELDALAAWFDAAVDDIGPRLGVVAGESGVGKSRLVCEFVAERRARGDRVLCGAATDHGFLPLEPWVSALRSGLAEAPVDVVAGVVVGAEAEFGAVPWLRDTLPGLPIDRLGTPDDRAVLAVVVRVLAGLAERSPVLVVIEDAQWCDQGSIELLAGVLAAEVPRCALLAVERRPFAARGAWHAADVDLHPRWEHIVRRLDHDACAALVDAVVSDRASVALADAVFDASGGNAFVALSLLELAHRSPLAPADLAVGLPGSASEIWAARFAPLSKDAAAVLAAASVVGTTFEPEVLGQAIADWPGTERAMVEALAAGLLTPADDGSLRFTHALLREHLYGALTATRRQRLHRAFATTLVERFGSSPSNRSAQLAHHFERSGTSGRADALRHLAAGARWAFEQGAPETAGDLCDRALELIEASPPLAPDLVALRQLELGEVMLRIGHPDGVATMLVAATHFERADDVSSAARIADALLRAGEAVGMREAGTDLAERLLGRLDEVDPRLESRILARLARAMEGRVGVLDLQSRLSARALRLARSEGDPETLAIALFCHCTDRPWTDDRLDHIRELVELGRTHDNLEYQLVGLFYLFTLLVDRGDVGDADRILGEATALGERIPPGYVGAIKNADLAKEARVPGAYRQVVQAYQAGRFSEQQRLLAEIMTYRDDSDLEQARLAMVVAIQAGLSAFDNDGFAEFAAFVEPFADERPEYIQRQICAAFVLAGAGRHADAHARVDPIIAAGLRPVTVDQTTSFMLVVLAWTAYLLRDPSAAAVVAEALEPYAGRNTCCLGGSMGPIDLGRALCHEVLGDHERALAHIDDAVAQCAEMQVRPFLAWSHLVRAQILRAAGGTPSAVNDAARRAIACARAGDGGLPAVVRQAEELIGDVRPVS